MPCKNCIYIRNSQNNKHFMINTNAVHAYFVFKLPTGFHHGSMQVEKSNSFKNLLFVENKKNSLSYLHPLSFTYNSVRLFLSPWEIPVDINNTHICTNRLTVRKTLLINKKYILRFFSTNGDLC